MEQIEIICTVEYLQASPILFLHTVHFPSKQHSTVHKRELTKILFNNNISNKDQWSLIKY
jgi:hypothetical protein